MSGSLFAGQRLDPIFLSLQSTKAFKYLNSNNRHFGDGLFFCHALLKKNDRSYGYANFFCLA